MKMANLLPRLEKCEPLTSHKCVKVAGERVFYEIPLLVIWSILKLY
jgi:hypothetical protein